MPRIQSCSIIYYYIKIWSVAEIVTYFLPSPILSISLSIESVHAVHACFTSGRLAAWCGVASRRERSRTLRQSGALLLALQHSAAGSDISVIAKSAVEEIVAAPASAICKKLAFDLIRSTRLTAQLWDTVCIGIHSDLDFPDPDVTAAAVSILAVILSYMLGKLITDCNKEISNCFDSSSDNLRFSITQTLGCILARDDLVTLCENNMSLLDKVSNWWIRIGKNMLDRSDAVSKVAFESIGRLFQEFDSKRMSRLAGDTLVYYYIKIWSVAEIVTYLLPSPFLSISFRRFHLRYYRWRVSCCGRQRRGCLGAERRHFY